mgnify:CR=1 FL=1
MINNWTINERFNKKRFYWLKDEEGEVYNPYDLGFKENMRDLCCPTRDYTRPHPTPKSHGFRGYSSKRQQV